jgi:hypothetical protein
MTAAIKWGGCVSDSMPVERGTRQGGLTSPLLFNIFYNGLVEHLDSMDCGITIRGVHCNVFCYADDLLLASTTTTSLQKLIDESVSVITADGLCFNPTKPFGKAHQKHSPTWSIGDALLVNSDCITYLEAQLKFDRGRLDTDRRAESAQKAFYSLQLQGAGLCFQGLDRAARCCPPHRVGVLPLVADCL